MSSLCRAFTRDRCSGSGLTANRINQSNASGLYPASDLGSRSPRPALCYRPLLALPRCLCARRLRVTWLEPRTLHQPEKPGTCQRTRMVLRICDCGVNENGVILNRVKSIEYSRFTGRCRIFVQAIFRNSAEARILCWFCEIESYDNVVVLGRRAPRPCGNRGRTCEEGGVH